MSELHVAAVRRAARECGLTLRNWSMGEDMCFAVYGAGDSCMGTVTPQVGRKATLDPLVMSSQWFKRDTPTFYRLLDAYRAAKAVI